MKFRSVNILIRGKCKHFFSLRLISPVFCFPFARLSCFCRFLRLFVRRLLPSARMDVVGTFRWHQVTFFLRFVTPARRLFASARRLVTYRPRDGKFTARGTASLPPEGRQVYRPRDGKFTARGTVSLPPVGR